jgi:shikimate kinase
MMIFVVGPSRGGKTTLVSAVLPQFPTLRLLDLDAEEERCVSFIRSKGGQPGGWEDRWRRNKECLRLADVSPPDTDLIVDVGAGSLETAEGRRFFIARGQSAIAVVALWPLVYSRHDPKRGQQEFRQTEYSDERRKVYRAARFQVDSSDAIDESVEKFREAIQRSLNSR